MGTNCLKFFINFLITISFVIKTEGHVSLNSLDSLIEQSLVKFKLNFHKLLETNRLIRKRRSVSYGFNPSSYHLKIGDREQLKVPNYQFKNIKTWSIVEEIDRTNLFWCDDYTFYLTSFDPVYGFSQIQSYSHQMKGWIPYKSTYFRFERNVYFVVLFQSVQKAKWSLALFQWNRYNNIIIKMNYVITTQGYTDVDVVTAGRQIYMAVSISYNNSYKFDDLRLYEWDATQFDLRVDEKVNSLYNIKLFTSSSTIFIVTTQLKSFSEGSWLFKYDRRFSKKLIQRQVKKVLRAIKVEHFIVNRMSYFIFIGPDEAKIYWINGEQFIEYQVLAGTFQAKDVATLNLPNGEVLISLLFEDHIRFYTLSENADYTETSRRLNLQMYNVQVTNIFFHPDSSNIYRAYLAMAYSSYSKTSYFSPLWYLTIEPHYPYKLQDPLLMCLHKATSLLDSRMNKLNQISKKVVKVWSSNKVQKITVPIYVKGRTIVSGKANVNKIELKSTSQVKTNATNSQLKSRLDKVYSSLSFMFDELSDNLYQKNKPNQTITGNLKFIKPIVALKSNLNEVSNDVEINGIKFSDLYEKSLRKSASQTITGRWSFLNTVYVDNLYLNGTLNSINPEDILLSNAQSTQKINGHFQFENVKMRSQLTAQKINGVSINNFITTGNQRVQYISGIKKLEKVESQADIRVINNTNGRNLTHHIINAIMVNETRPQYLNGHIKFLNQLRVDNLYITGFINKRVNISQMLKQGVRVNGYQSIYGTKTFNKVSAQNVSLSGQLNGLNVPYDLISIKHNQKIFGNVVFKAPVIIKSNLQANLINNINLKDEIMLRNSHVLQHIYGFKTFASQFTVNGNILVKDYVTLNNIDLSRFNSRVQSLHKSILNRPLIFEDLIVTGNITTYSTVNNELIQNFSKLLWSKSKQQIINVRATFAGPVNIDWLRVNHINNLNFPKDFVIKNLKTFQYITAPKRFHQAIFRSSKLMLAKGVKVNNFDLNTLYSRLVLTSPYGNQTNPDRCWGKKLFKNLEVHGNIYAKSVNGLDVEKEVMLTNQEQIINGNFTFNSPLLKINHLQTRGLISKSTLLNYNISYWLSDIILKSRGRVALNNKYFDYEVTSNKLNAEGTIDGINVNLLLARAVKTNVDQVIKGPIVFKSGLHFYKPMRVNLINGLDLFNHTSNLIFKSNPREISGKKTIYGNVTIKGNLLVGRYINKINLTDLTWKAASRVRQNVFTAPVTFTNSVNIDRLTLSPFSTIDGVTFSDLILLNSDAKILGTVILKHTRVDHNLTVLNNIINGCNLTKLAKESIYVNSSKPQYLYNSARFQYLHVLGNLIITSNYVNHIDIKTLTSKLISLSSNQAINTSLIFEDHVTVDNLIIRQTINNIDISYLLNDCVQRSIYQSIKGLKTFEHQVTVKTGKLILNGDVTLFGIINGMNVNQLNRSLVTSEGNFLIKGVKKFLPGSKLVFVKDVHIFKSEIGGIALRDIILLKSNSTITYPTFFRAPVYAKHDLNLLGNLNGQNLTNIFTTAVSLSKKELIYNDLVFNDTITIDHLLVHKFINNIPIASLVTRSGNNIITGNYKFRNGVIVYGNIDMGSNSTINNVNLKDIMARRVNLFKPEIVTGKVIFNNAVELRRGITLDAINGNNPTQLKSYYTNYTRQVRDAMKEYRLKASEQNRFLRQNYEGALHQKINLEYFDIYLEFDYIDDNNQEISIERFITSPFMKSSSYLSKYTFGPIYPYLYGWRVYYNSNCLTYSTIVYKISKEGNLVEKSSGYTNGRAFPIIQYLDDYQISFSVWTNTTDCLNFQKTNYTYPYPEVTLIKTVISKPNIDVSRQKFDGKLKHLSIRSDSAVSKDFKYFNDGKSMYLVVAFAFDKMTQSAKTDTLVFKFDPVINEWIQIQKIATFGAKKLDLIYYAKEKMILLAICNSLTISGKPMPSFVLKWEKEAEQFKQIAAVKTSNPTDILFLEAAKGDELFLIISNKKRVPYSGDCNIEDEEIILEAKNTFSSYFSEYVNVYNFHFNGKEFAFKMVQVLNHEDVNTLDKFHLPPDDTYLILGSKTMGRTYIHKLKGFNLFEHVLNFPSFGVEDVKSFWSSDGKLFLAIGSSTPGKSKILKAYMSGPMPSRKMLRAFLKRNKSF